MEYVDANSFINLFPEIIYDNDQIAQRSLDIWNAYRILANVAQGDPSVFLTYMVNPSDTLTKLSVVFYGTDRLWWIIPMVNDAEDPFDFLRNVIDGTEGVNGSIKVLKSSYLADIIFKLKIIKETNDTFKSKQGDN